METSTANEESKIEEGLPSLGKVMSFSKLEELSKKLVLIDSSNYRFEFFSGDLMKKPFVMGNDPKYECPREKEPEKDRYISLTHCEINYHYEKLKFAVKDYNSTNGTFIYLPKGKEFLLEKDMVFRNDENLNLAVKDFNIEKKLLIIEFFETSKRNERKTETIDLNKNYQIEKSTQLKINKTGKPVLLNLDDKG